MRFPRIVLASLAVLMMTGLSVAAASASVTSHTTAKASLGTVVVGNEGFPESDIMQNIYGDLLQHLGYTVKYQSTGSRQDAIPALEAGTIDVEPDYAGSLLVYLDAKDTKQAGTLSSAESATNAILKAKGAVELPGTSGLDQNVFVVTKATAKKDNLSDLSQLKKYASKWNFGAPPECSQNYFCAPGLKKVYGIVFKSLHEYDESGPLTVAALKSNTAQVVELFSTDNVISQDGFVSLKDNLNLEPADHLVAIVRSKFDTPAVQKALESVNKDLTTSALVGLDAAPDGPTKPSVQAIAEGFLQTEKLLP